MTGFFFNAAFADLMQMNMRIFYEQVDSVVNLGLAFNFSCCLLLSCVSAGSKKSCCPLVVNMQKLHYCKRREDKCGVPSQDFQRLLRENTKSKA